MKNNLACKWINAIFILLLLTTSNNITFAQQIIIDNNTKTTMNVNGKTTDISTTTIKNGNAFNSFERFNVNTGNTVNLIVPNSSKNLINLVTSEKSLINGTLNSIQNSQIGGHIYLVNPNGITVGQEGIINVGSLTAVTPSTDYMENFFTSPGNPNDTYVNNLINGNVSINPDTTINIEGKIKAIEEVKLSSGSIINRGKISASSTPEYNIETEDIVNSETNDKATDCSVLNGDIYLTSTDIVTNSGSISAHNNLFIKANNHILLDNTSLLSSKNNVILDSNFISIGGKIDSSGESGGNIHINATELSLAGNITAKGSSGNGGNINIVVKGNTLETTSSFIDVSGNNGGTISHIAGNQITTSGNYNAIGTTGNGGIIDISAPALKFLSTSIDASGYSNGGNIRLGGEYQGGKYLPVDELPNSQIIAMTDSTKISTNSTGPNGNGGNIITWADLNAVVLGTYSAKPGYLNGNGGFVEVSAGDTLTFGGLVDTSYAERTGTFLLDPKNIVVADVDYNQYYIIIGYNYNELNDNVIIDNNDHFGSSVSLFNNRMVIGAKDDDGFNNIDCNNGAVYLYTFEDSYFNGGKLEGIIGLGYTGGKNINIPLEDSDNFGASASLNGNRLVVGAPGDDGFGNGNTNSGAVYLYSFSDSTFSGGTLEGIIGSGYIGGKNIYCSLEQ